MLSFLAPAIIISLFYCNSRIPTSSCYDTCAYHYAYSRQFSLCQQFCQNTSITESSCLTDVTRATNETFAKELCAILYPSSKAIYIYFLLTAFTIILAIAAVVCVCYRIRSCNRNNRTHPEDQEVELENDSPEPQSPHTDPTSNAFLPPTNASTSISTRPAPSYIQPECTYTSPQTYSSNSPHTEVPTVLPSQDSAATNDNKNIDSAMISPNNLISESPDQSYLTTSAQDIKG